MAAEIEFWNKKSMEVNLSTFLIDLVLKIERCYRLP
jgi:hypothetical protein